MALVTGCSTAPTLERRIVEEAAAALGGLARLRAVTTLSIAGSGEVWALGQNRTHESELLKWEVHEYRRQPARQHREAGFAG